MMNKDIAIKVEHVSKIFKIPHEQRNTIRERIITLRKKTTYEKFDALKDVSFEIRKGEFFGIIGRNGSGKSTLLKILAGIYTPDSGSVQVNGEISPFLELGVGFNPELSGKDNIYLNGTILGLTKKEIDKKYDKIVEFSELERFIHLKLKNYSSGMQVRLAFSVSIHANKDILLMDEVLAVGDTNFQAKCLSEFIRFKESGKTVILVTHDTNTVQRYCDRAMLLGNGGVSQLGRSDEIVSAYIDQNMSDEEKRLKEIKEKIPEKPMIQESIETDVEIQSDIKEVNNEPEEKKKVKITGLSFFDEKGEMKNVFATGEDLNVKVYFTIYDHDISVLNFGLALFSQENLYISGINTIIDKIDTDQYLLQGYFEVKYPKIQLTSNSYYFKVSVFEDNDNKVLDFMHKSIEFTVVSKSLNHGAFQLNYCWA
jgi:lipopolysaccharide transport system ATP-binding protein